MEDCQYCTDGVCNGCGGTGEHPHAGTGKTERERVDIDAKCSWCGGDGKCSADLNHWEVANRGN